ncbi:MAG TPA: aminotransferase class IV [Puia sp.]|nr:aminotransferase class IV [Puia sp.]
MSSDQPLPGQADGVFETMRLMQSRIPLGDYHFDRLFNGMQTLQIDVPAGFTRERLTREIIQLCRKNKQEQAARVRLTVSRGNTSFTAGQALYYTIESSPLKVAVEYPGLVVDLFPDGRKAIDSFANSKTINRLLYSMSHLYVLKNKLDSCLVLNPHDRICDATIDNVFCIRNRMIYTPPLSEGGIAGVMRRFLLEQMQQMGFLAQEKIMDDEFLKHSDEIFLSNAVRGIRPVRRFGEKEFGLSIGSSLAKKVESILVTQANA